ncbi:MAG: molybdenum cofactor biosynthesis protein MoaE [Gemmatimonadaceae bacterium]
MRVAIVERPIDGGGLLSEVSRETNGAAILFIGTVRDANDGRRVSGIEYSAYEQMAEDELKAIAGEASSRFGTESIVVEHRVGHLEIGETSVGIAVAHPHRAAAYDASRFIIEQIKLRVPIWKREEYVDGSRHWIDPTAIRERVER